MSKLSKDTEFELLFQTTGQIIQQWISHVSEKKITDLFKEDEISVKTRPLYVSKSNKKLYEIKLSMVPHDYKINLTPYLSNEYVMSALGGLILSVKKTFPAIMGSLIDKSLFIYGLTWDNINNNFYAEFVHEEFVKKETINKCITKLLNQKQNGKVDDEWKINWTITLNSLNEIEKKINENNINELCIQVNNKLKTKQRIGFKISEIYEKNIPKHYNIKSVPKISDKQYINPEDEL